MVYKATLFERCYKLHGYPPGYRQKNTSRAPSSTYSGDNSSQHSSGKFSFIKTGSGVSSVNSVISSASSNNADTLAQCQSLTLLQSQLDTDKNTTVAEPVPSSSYVAGIYSNTSLISRCSHH